MKSIINLIKERDCGLLRFTLIRNYGYDLHKIMETLGLYPSPNALMEIDNQDAVKVLEAIFWKDLAYGEELIPRSEANEYASKLIEEFNEPDINYYTNGDWENHHSNTSIGWRAITGATFDAGIFIVHHDYVVFIWVEDED